MADTQVLREYLVSLGFDLKMSQFAQFERLLKMGEGSVAKSGLGMVKTITGVAGAIVGAYTAIGLATIGLMDKVADSDLGYQLYAMRMYMTVDAAKHLKIATDALGHSLDEIAWNPELFKRYQNLVKLQERLESKLGPDFEGRMRGIRDFRFELTRLQVVMQYLAMGVAANVFSRLEKDLPGLSSKVEHFIDYVTENLPKIADQIGQRLAPVIINIAHGAKAIATSMMSFLGLLFDDDKMRKGTLNIENLGRAIGHVVTFFTTLVEEIIGLGELLVHIAKIAYFVGQITSGHPIIGAKNIAQEWGSLKADLGRHATNIGASVALDVPPPTVPGGNAGRGNAGATPTASADQARQLAKQVSARTGIPADYIFAQWAHETGGFTSRAAIEQRNWGGIKAPGGMGYRTFGSPQEFADFYANLMLSKRYQGAGVGAAQSPSEFAAALKRGGYYEDSYANYSAGLRRWAPQFGSGGNTQIDVGGVQVHIMQPNASPEQIYQATNKAINDSLGKRAQRNIAEFGGPYN